MTEQPAPEGPATDDTIEAAQHGFAVGPALRALMLDVAWIGKNDTMDQGGRGGKYQYRSIEDVIAALGSRARAHGLALGSSVLAGPEYDTHEVPKQNGGSTRWTTCRGLVIEYRWTSLLDGSTISAVGVGEGRDAGDKATNKAMTAAYKYALTQSTMLPTFDPDPDGQHPAIETDGPAPQGQPEPEGPDRSPDEVLTAIRSAGDMNTLGAIYDWLDERQLLQEQHDGQTFMAHLEAARAIIDPEGGEAGNDGAQGGGPHG